MNEKYISPAQKIARSSLKSKTGKKEEFIRKGIQLIQENGYDNVTIEDITKVCQTSKGSFYYYFETKEDLVMAAVNGLVDDAYIQEKLSEQKGSMIEKLRCYIMLYADMMENRIGWDFNRLWAKMVLDSQKVNQRLQFDMETVMSIFKEGIDKGELKKDVDYSVIGKLVINYLYGASFSWDLDKENMHILETAESFCDAIEALMQQYLAIGSK